MKRLILIPVALLLSGCLSTVPKMARFPDAPPEIKTACPELAEADRNTTELSKLLDVIVTNYSTYYECRVKVDAWIEWHKEQKKIYDDLAK
jgi:hypothetical protein